MGWVTMATAKSLAGTYTADGDVTYLGLAEPSSGCWDTIHFHHFDCGRTMLGPCGIELRGGGFLHNIHCKGFYRNTYC